MSISPALFSSAKGDWETPESFFATLDEEFHFNLDVAATQANKKTMAYLGPDHPIPERRNALLTRWADYGSRIWHQPPYGRQLGDWFENAFLAWKDGAVVVSLVPARTDTEWFHTYCKGHELRFVKGRLKFKVDITSEMIEEVESRHELTITPKDIAKGLGLPLMVIHAILNGKTVADEPAPFPSLVVIMRPEEPQPWVTLR